jgi:hypothetical protein
MIKFKASNLNQGAMTIQERGKKLVTLHHSDGRPLTAGDVKQGQWVTFNRFTGEVTAIEDDEMTLEKILEIIDDEPELEGEPPPQVYIQAAKDLPELLRATVRATKKSIADRMTEAFR